MSAGLPNMAFIRNQVPIADVASALGIRIAGPKSAHCWRDAHKNGDRTPSLSLHRNRAKCFVCDADSLSNIDLVIRYHDCSLREAVEWICGRWIVPTIAKNQKLSRPERWKTSPVGFSAFPLEDLVRSGFWATLDDAARAILAVLFCFSEKGEAAISYRGLSRYSGKTSDTTISKVLRRFEQIGLLKALPKTVGNFREVNRYRITLDNSEFQNLLRRIHEHTKAERDGERQLRSELRVTASSNPSTNPKGNPQGDPAHTQVNTVSTVVECEQSARSSRVECEGWPTDADTDFNFGWMEKRIPAKERAENKPHWTTPHFTVVERQAVAS